MYHNSVLRTFIALIIWLFGNMFVLLPSAVQSIKQESMEQQFEMNRQQWSLFRGHPKMNVEYLSFTLNSTTRRTNFLGSLHACPCDS